MLNTQPDIFPGLRQPQPDDRTAHVAHFIAAAHFLRETVGRVRYGGARGQLTVRADCGFYTHALVAVCREMNVRFSITIRQHARLRNLIEAIPEADWTPIRYWMDAAAAVSETTYRACPNK